MQPILSTLLLALTTLLPFTFAQFQFFEQMFQGGHQHPHQQQQQAQNVASDSEWYQQTYESGKIPLPFPSPQCPMPKTLSPSPFPQPNTLANRKHSTLHQLPLPLHPRLRPFSPPLPLRLSRC